MLFIAGLSHHNISSMRSSQLSAQIMFKMSAFSFDAHTKSNKSYLLFTRYSGYTLQMRWIHLYSSDVMFLWNSVHQNY